METRINQIWWVLRVGAAACFIGHGAFGIIGKEAWLPYFALVGIGPDWAFRLMPIVGSVDILAGISVLLRPRPFVLLYMTLWALWTASLRPLTGDAFAELIERAGNYGVPLALLFMSEWPRDFRSWFRGSRRRSAESRLLQRVSLTLLGTTAALLTGHALLGIAGKPGLLQHYTSLGLAGAAAAGIVGRFELGLVALALALPTPVVAAFVAGWKLATESLYLVAGAPFWEVVERGGSYAAPLALLVISRAYRLPRLSFSSLTPRASVAVVVLGFVLSPMTARAQSSDERVLALLKRGELALACRHAITDHTHEDQNPVVFSDRTTQRNLSAAGEQQARDIGAAIRAAGIPIGDVYSNPLFRTKETATLAFGRVTPIDSLGDGAVLRRMMTPRVTGAGNRVFVTRNGMLMTAFRGVTSISFAEGDCAAVEPRDSNFAFVAKITPSDFARLAGLPGRSF